MKPIIIPNNYDYIGIYLTDKCPLKCPYCITNHQEGNFGHFHYQYLTPQEWIEAMNRLILPKDVPITLQGGEPFVYKGIWEILENVHHKVDIMTALPRFLKREHFLKLKTLDWNKGEAPYPTIRVSWHKGQNDYKELIERIAGLNDILSIGLYYLGHPGIEAELEDVKAYAKKYKVELRHKDFLGEYEGQKFGNLKFPDAVTGIRKGIKVYCKNTVVPVAPDGTIFLCHSDLYANRRAQALGNVLDEEFVFPDDYLPCPHYGLCNECDVKIKTNHYQQFGYTSVDILFEDQMQKRKKNKEEVIQKP